MQYPKNEHSDAKQRIAKIVSSLELLLNELDALNLALPAVKIAEAIDHLAEATKENPPNQQD